MNRLSSRLLVGAGALVTMIGLAGVSPRGQMAPKAGEWPTYSGDLAATRYSPLEQINATNFSKLQLAFRFKTDNLGPRPEFQYQATPLMVNGRLFTTAGTRRAVVSLDATTGEMKWMHSIEEGKRGEAAPRQLSGRGLSYWSDGKDERIIYVTPGYQMVALDAKTGLPVKNFGTDGIVDLKTGLDQEGLDLTTAEIGLHAAPIISKDVIVIGAAHREGGAPKSKTNVKGFIRGFDVRTGKRIWIFHTIPMKGETGYDTWDPDAAAYTGNAGVWAPTKSSASSTCPSSCRPATITVAIAAAIKKARPRRRCSLKRCSRSISRRGSASGTTSSCITGSGTTTFRARRS